MMDFIVTIRSSAEEEGDSETEPFSKCFILIRRDYFDRCFVNLTGGFDFAKFGHFTVLETRLFITQGQLIVVLGQKQ